MFLEHSVAVCWTGQHQDILGAPSDCGSVPPSASHKTAHPVFTLDGDSTASGTPGFLA